MSDSVAYAICASNGARLLQISGGGRVRVRLGHRDWWVNPLTIAPWSVTYAKDDSGAIFTTMLEAQRIAKNLSGPLPIEQRSEGEG